MGSTVISGPIVSVNILLLIRHILFYTCSLWLSGAHKKIKRIFFSSKRFTTNENMLFTSLAEDATLIKDFVTIERNCRNISHFDKNVWVVRAC